MIRKEVLQINTHIIPFVFVKINTLWGLSNKFNVL